MEKYLRELSARFRTLSAKIKLISLLETAKNEYDKHNLKEGYDALLKAYELDKKNSVTLRGLGCFKQSEGDFEGAIDYYKKALEFSETKEIEYTLIGTAFYVQDKLDDALIYFNKAIDENDSYDPAYEGRNQAMLENHLKLVDLQESLKKYF